MSAYRKKRKNSREREQARFTVRGIRREQVDLRKFSKALLGLAQAEAERQARAQHTTRAQAGDKPEVPSDHQPKGDTDAAQP
jgi:hypothetical protein